MKNFIWLFGENIGETHNNNSYYMWDQIVSKNDNIDKYLVLINNEKNKKFYKLLDKNKQKKIVWKNSLRHFKLFKKADMYFVTLSYKDILPEKILWKDFKFIIKRPLIYLQHGTIAIKKLGYNGKTYYNNLFRFIYYNPKIKDSMIKENDMKDYQLYNGEFHPRYKELVRLHLEKKNNEKKKIVFFITWREYFGDNFSTRKFINKLNKVFENEKFKKYISDNNNEVILCLHQFYDEEKTKKIRETVKDTSIKIVNPKDIDIMKELATCDLLITDYSSVGFDCTVLNTPVILFQPDFEEYFKIRETYCDLDELSKNSIISPDKLVDTIIKENYGINKFFRERLPEKIDFDYITQGKHIDKMYEYFKKLQENRITILGYNFSGKGGTVTATKAIAETLLEEGYLVELQSLKITEKNYSLPYGLASNAFMNRKQKAIINKIKRLSALNKKYYYYFNYDINKPLLNPYIGKSLKKYLENTKSRTIISMRESIHLFVKNFANDSVKNKIYFYHTDSTVLDDYYHGLLDEIKKYNLENCVFVTETSKNAYKNDLKYEQYDKAIVLGNTLSSSSMSTKEEIESYENETNANTLCTVLMRLSEDRKNDVNNIINFGKYLYNKKCENIKIDVYGMGKLENYLMDSIIDNNLEDIIDFKGATDDSKGVILASDCVIDFSNNQSFGMIYLESILNGKPVYAKHNVGSNEVLKDIKEAYYETDEELYNKIINVKNITKKELLKNYDIISRKFSRKASAKKLEELIK